MKKNLLYILLAVTVLAGCDKNDGPVPVPLARVPGVLVNIDPASDKFISPVNPAGFKGKVNVDLLFPNEKPQSVDVVIMRNKNPSDVKVFKAGVTSFPTPIEITGQQLIDLFGQPITGGTSFIFGANINLADGQTIIPFPAAGAVSYGSGAINVIANLKPGSTTQVEFLMPCPFNSDAYAGTFTVLQDDWNDYKVGAEIQVSKISATQISFEYAVDAGTAQPIKLTINPADNSISVAKQVYGSYGSDVFSCESVAGPASAVNPCDVSLSVRLIHTTPGYTFTGTIRLKKK